MIRFTKHAQEAIVVRDIAADWIETAVSAPDRIEPDPHATPTAHGPIKQSRNMVPAFCGLCTDVRAMISWSLQCISIAEPGDDQNFF